MRIFSSSRVGSESQPLSEPPPLRILITGAGGFVGRWLAAELASANHQVVALDRAALDVTDPVAVRAALAAARPDAIAHLAGVSFAPDAARNPEAAHALAVSGTTSVIEALLEQAPHPAVLVTGTAAVYAPPIASELPLSESSRVEPSAAYGQSKLAQETVVLESARREVLRAVVTRASNHIGPGQRTSFVVPALASRIWSMRRGLLEAVMVGNLDVARDFTDVRDVVRAYRLVLEGLADGSIPAGGMVLNVGAGRSTRIRAIFDQLCALAEIDCTPEVDASLVRLGEPSDISVSPARLSSLTSWAPAIPLERSIADVWAEVTSRGGEPS